MKDSRREFTGKAGLPGSGIILGMNSNYAGNNRTVGANDKIRIGFIVVGNRGSQLLQIFMDQPDCEIAALCNVYEPSLTRDRSKVDPRYLIDRPGQIPKMGEIFPIKVERYSDYRKLLENKSIDAVCIATPDHWHAIMTIDAIKAGKDVYIEKPLSKTIHEGRAMVNADTTTSPDDNSQYLNPSKYAFSDEKFGFSVSYIPWLQELVSDINLAYLSGFFRIGNNQTISSSMRYFSMGEIQLSNQNKTKLENMRPNEFAFNISYSRKLSDYFSGGIALRFIKTDTTGCYCQEAYSPGKAFGTDVSFFYNKKRKGTTQTKMTVVGINFSNIGSKISYNDGQTKKLLPASMRLGVAFTNEFDNINSLSFSLDINNLFMPTPSSQVVSDSSGGTIVLTENNSNQSVIGALFSSFSDAPEGFKEELQENTILTGLEYWYNKRFAIRTEYFNESQNKGNRKYYTAGAGVKMKLCLSDFSYLMPMTQNNPLENTIQFTILFNAESLKKEKKSMS